MPESQNQKHLKEIQGISTPVSFLLKELLTTTATNTTTLILRFCPDFYMSFSSAVLLKISKITKELFVVEPVLKDLLN